MKVSELVELAIGSEGVRHLDYAIPQAVFDGLTPAERADIAGWYYDASAPTFGRLLTQTECWAKIRTAVECGSLLIVDPVAYADGLT